MQFYLPADQSQSHLGTEFYRKASNGNFTLSKRLAFVPNSAYGFAVTDHSFHAVNTLSQTDGTRNSIILIYYGSNLNDL
jgi:hypothetical protein